MIRKERAVYTLEGQTGELEFFQLDQLEKLYQRFLPWWEENSSHFSTLSFNIENQTQQFIKDIKGGADFETAFLKIRSDLWGYYLEYIKQEAILPFTNRIKNGRLVGDFYGDKPIVDLVDEKEREGALFEAMVDLEKKVLGLQRGEFIFRASPKGWTNMDYDYIETQFQIFWREDNIVRGLTIRTGVDLKAVGSLFNQLRIKFSGTTERELLKEITKTNLVLTSASLTEIIELISLYSGGLDHQGRELLPQYKRWQENDGNYQRYDQLVSLLQFLKMRFASLIPLMKKDQEINNQELESLLAFALMVMAEKERWEKEEKLAQLKPVSITSDTYYPPIDPSSFSRAFSYLQSLPGCAGGGSFSSHRGDFILTSFGPVGVENLNKEKSRLECVTCPFCQKVVDAEIVSEKGKQFIHCPSCGAKVEKN